MREWSPEEKSLRKLWLVLSMVIMWVWPLISLGFLVFVVTKGSMPQESYAMFLWVYISVTVLSGIVYYVLYRCSYVKQGYKFLTGLMIVWPILKVKALADAVKSGHDMVAWISIGVNVGLFVWWYVLSLKIIKMNKIP